MIDIWALFILFTVRIRYLESSDNNQKAILANLMSNIIYIYMTLNSNYTIISKIFFQLTAFSLQCSA